MKKTRTMFMMAGVLAIGLAASSCSNKAVVPNPDKRGPVNLTIKLKGSTSSMLKDGEDIKTNGDEGTVKNWGIFAYNTTDGKYEYTPVADSQLKKTVKDVLNSSEVYVIINPGDDSQFSTYTTVDQIKAISETVDATKMKPFNDGLQTYEMLPDKTGKTISFSGSVMLMGGHANASTATLVGGKEYKLDIPVTRQYTKVKLVLDAQNSADQNKVGTGKDVEVLKINSIENVSVMPLSTTLNPFGVAVVPPATGDMQYTFDPTDAAHNDLAQFKVVDGTKTDAHLPFYATPNPATGDADATEIIVKANVDYQLKGGRLQTNQTRYYRAVVSEQDHFNIEANALYVITAAFNTAGHEKEDDKSIDLDVTAKIEDWTLKTNSGDFQ